MVLRQRLHSRKCKLQRLEAAVPAQVTVMKVVEQGCDSERSRPLSLTPAVEEWCRFFAQEERQAIRIKSSEALPKRTNFVCTMV